MTYVLYVVGSVFNNITARTWAIINATCKLHSIFINYNINIYYAISNKSFNSVSIVRLNKLTTDHNANTSKSF